MEWLWSVSDERRETTHPCITDVAHTFPSRAGGHLELFFGRSAHWVSEEGRLGRVREEFERLLYSLANVAELLAWW